MYRCLSTHRLFVALLFALTLVAFYTYRDYGATADAWLEFIMIPQQWALITEHYLRGDFADPYSHIIVNLEHYGTFFNALAYGAQWLFSDLDPLKPAVYEVKNLFTFCFCLMAYIAVYKALLLCTRDARRSAVAAVIALSTLPYFYGHSLMNPKDAPFAAMYTASSVWLASLCLKLAHGTWQANRFPWRVAAWGGLLIGLTCSIRLPGLILLPAAALLYFMALWHLKPPRARWADSLPGMFTAGAVASAVALGVVVILHPAAWPHPLSWLEETSQYFTRFPLEACNLTDGWLHQSHPPDFPAYYTISWLWAKTPVHLIALALAGVVFGLRALFCGRSLRQRLLIAALALQGLSIPLLMRLQDSTMYDGIRQVLFIQPVIAFFAAYGFIALLQRFRAPPLRNTLYAVLVLCTLHTAYEMARLHPYQYIYFNQLARGKDITANWSTDYWLLSLKESVDWLNARPRPELGVKSNKEVGRLAVYGRPGVGFYEKEYRLPRPFYFVEYAARCGKEGSIPRRCVPVHVVRRPLGGQSIDMGTIYRCRR